MPALRASSRCRRSANSGTASASACPAAAAGSRSSSVAAAAFIISIRPAPSRPITPAVTPDSTESNSRRRRSVSSLAAISASRWPFTCRVISLKVRPSSAISSSPRSSRTRTSRSPCPTRSAAAASRPTGRDSRSANQSPIHIAAEDHHQREAEIDQRELEEQPPAVRLELLVEPHRLLGLVEQAQDLAVDLAADVEEVVGEGVELQQRPELVVLPVLDDHDLAGARPLDVRRAPAGV